jgi:hypothetical protein
MIARHRGNAVSGALFASYRIEAARKSSASFIQALISHGFARHDWQADQDNNQKGSWIEDPSSESTRGLQFCGGKRHPGNSCADGRDTTLRKTEFPI